MKKGYAFLTLVGKLSCCLILLNSFSCEISTGNNIGSTSNNTTESVEVDNATLSKEQKKSFYNGTIDYDTDSKYDTPYGVGRSINALTDQYIVVPTGHSQVFNADKITSLKWTKTAVKEQGAQIISEESAEEFQNTNTAGYNRKTASSIGIEGLFTAGLESSFEISNTLTITKNTHQIFTKYSQNITSFAIEIDGYRDYRNFYDLLSESLIDDVEKIRGNELSISKFFEFYGTHVVMAGYYGGRIECYSHIMFEQNNLSNDSMISYMNKVSAEIKDVETSAKVGASYEEGFKISNCLGLKNEAKKDSFTFKAKGGVYIPGISLKDFQNNYGNWVNSFNESEDVYSVLVDVPDNSLMPIWYLLPEEYSDVKEMIEEKFISEAENCKNLWLQKCAFKVRDEVYYDDIDISSQAKYCDDNNGYRPVNSSIDDATRHDGFEVVKLYVDGCAQTEDGKFYIGSREQFALNLEIQKDPLSLPTVNSQLTKINDDSYMGSIYGIDSDEVKKQKVGLGMYIVTVNYKDKTSDVFFKNDIFKNKYSTNNAKWINIDISKINQNKLIDSIAVTVIYEFQVGGPGFLGIWWYETPNWRCDFYLDFN